MNTEPLTFRLATAPELYTKCRRCGRGLRSEKATRLGYGSVCARKVGATLSSAEKHDRDELDPPNRAPMETDVRVWRDADGRVRANVPRSAIWHSPDGFECGYGGSGPADLALCILNAFVPPGRPVDWDDENENPVRDDRPEEVYRGTVSYFAARHHQAFKWRFIATMDHGGNTIPAEHIRRWIADAPREL